jgi:GAF domain-containing protein
MDRVSNSRPSAEVVNHLQDLVLNTGDVQELLDELVRFSSAVLADSAFAFCSISLIRRQKPVTVASSEERATQLDETQYRSDGPCLTAIRDHTTIHVPDVTREDRWPEFAAASRRVGVGSSLSIPLVLEGDAEAGLNLYSTRSHGFSGGDIDTIEAYALRASKALRLSVRISQLAETKTHLHESLASRTTIDLAAGVLMAQNRCNHTTAMQILTIAASARDLTVADVAASILASIAEDPTITTHFDG